MTLLQRRLALTFAVVSALLVLADGRARASAALVVVIARDTRSPAVEELKIELSGLGLEVMVLNATAENSAERSSLERTARTVGAIAAIRLVPAGAGVEVWVADRVTGKTIMRDLETPSGEGRDMSADAVAVGAVELLRASLMELHADAPPHGEVVATPQVTALALPVAPRPASTGPRASLTASAGSLLGFTNVGPSGDAQLALALPIWKRVGVRGFVSQPVIAARQGVPEGVVRVGSQWLGLFATYDWLDSAPRWFFTTGAGAAASHVTSTGDAVPGSTRQGQSDTTWLGGPTLGLALGYRFTNELRLRLDATGLMMTSRPEILVAGRSIARWGEPALLVAAGVEVFLSR